MLLMVCVFYLLLNKILERQEKFIKPKFIEHNSNVPQIALLEDTDATPQTNEVVLVKKGTANAGSHYYYNGTSWEKGQLKNKVNTIMFDMFDSNGKSFADEATYEATTFVGNKVFSYKEGTGTADTELGFITYLRALTNVGDITFNFDLLTEQFSIQELSEIFNVKTDTGFLKTYTSLNTFSYKSGWQKAKNLSRQKVIRQYDVVGEINPIRN